MPDLLTLLNSTMLFTGAPGSDAKKYIHNGTTPITASPGPTRSKEAANAAIWSWKYSLDTPNKVTEVNCDVSSIGYKRMRVCDEITWDDPSVTFDGVKHTLPLTPQYRIQTFYMKEGSIKKNNSKLWQLEANLDASLLIIYGYEFYSSATTPNPIAPSAYNSPDFMYRLSFKNQVAVQGTTRVAKTIQWQTDVKVAAKPGDTYWVSVGPKTVIVCMSLVCCKERNDFTPALYTPLSGKDGDDSPNPVYAARIFPHFMVMTNFDLIKNQDQLMASIRMRRPAKSSLSCHADMQQEIKHLLIADTNEARNMKNLVRSSPLVPHPFRVMPLLPFWDNIFDYFDDNPLMTSKKFVAVDPDKKDEIIDGAAKYDGRNMSWFTKAARQGEYDNLHIAPRMKAPVNVVNIINTEETSREKLGMNQIAMAPFCFHDCLHTHWRWGDGLFGKHVKGWSGHKPYAEKGAPLVASNQKVEVELTGPDPKSGGGPGFVLRAIISKGLGAGAWQVINHHGSAYGTDVSLAVIIAQNLALLHATVVKMSPSIQTYISAGDWWAIYWALRYEDSYELPSFRLTGKRERIAIKDLTLARKGKQ